MFGVDEDAFTAPPPAAYSKQLKGQDWQDPEERRMALYDTLASALADRQLGRRP